MSGTAWNLKKMVQKHGEAFLRIVFRLFFCKIFAVLQLEKKIYTVCRTGMICISLPNNKLKLGGKCI
jgi:hypothetical protein